MPPSPVSGEGGTEAGANVKTECFCRWCKAGPITKKQEFLIETSDGSWLDCTWGGKLWGCCFECSSIEDLSEFKRKARASWNSRQEATGERAERLRNIVFKEGKAKVLLECNDLPNWKVREVVLERLQGLMLVLGAAFARRPAEVKAAIIDCTRTYVSDITESALRPDFVANTNGISLTNVEAGWLTQVTEGLWISWQCRFISCAWYGLNTEWIKHAVREWYRCPHCGRQYQPWTEGDGKLMKGVQKTIVMMNPISGKIVAFGATWPHNEEDSWLNRMVEIRARELTVPSDRELGGWLVDTAVGLKTLLTNVEIPHTWEKFTLQSTTTDMFHESTYPPCNYERIKQNGYYGQILPPSGWAEPFNQWEQMITLFARMVVGVESQLGRKVV